jgi:transcriptional regulator with XRE-family HTH domain/plasmid maintenance system antidote protein VapI
MFQYDDEEGKESIGSILRRQRERKKLKLEEISEELRIRPQHLEALENDRFQLLPGALYQRSFLKTYAEYLDLDHSRILKMFDRYQESQGLLRKEPEGTRAVEESTEGRPHVASQPQSVAGRAGYWFAVFTGLTLGMVCLIYLAKPGTRRTGEIASQLSAATAESLVAEPEVLDTTSLAWRLDNLLVNSPEMLLRIEAEGDSWVKVTADKKSLFSGILAAGMAIEFKAHDYFSIHLGKNEGIDFFLNGMKMRPLEKEIHLLDKENYRSFFSEGPVRQDFEPE